MATGISAGIAAMHNFLDEHKGHDLTGMWWSAGQRTEIECVDCGARAVVADRELSAARSDPERESILDRMWEVISQ